MITHGLWDQQSADRAEVTIWPPVSLTVQLLVLDCGHALLARLLVLLAVGLLAVNAAVFHKSAGHAVLELDGATPGLAAVGAGFVALVHHNRRAVHHR